MQAEITKGSSELNLNRISQSEAFKENIKSKKVQKLEIENVRQLMKFTYQYVWSRLRHREVLEKTHCAMPNSEPSVKIKL